MIGFLAYQITIFVTLYRQLEGLKSLLENVLSIQDNMFGKKQDTTIDILSAIDIFVDFRIIRLYKIG